VPPIDKFLANVLFFARLCAVVQLLDPAAAAIPVAKPA
jgi:hypothetical protein